MLESHNYFCN
jgi:hypothetical protein